MARSRLLLILAALVVALGIGGFIVYDQVLRGDSAAALSLPGASTPVGSALPNASFDGVVAGTWSVAGGSQAGYRVREQLANLPAQSDAVGRTDKVTGSMTLETSGTTTTLTAASLSVDTTSITSDKSMRDSRLRTEGLETDRFPTAAFKLTKPVPVPSAALSGTATAITLTGDLTVHGVTRSVEVPAQAQLVGGTIQVAGSIAFPLADYSIVAPNLGGMIISIADTGALEFLVNFNKR